MTSDGGITVCVFVCVTKRKRKRNIVSNTLCVLSPPVQEKSFGLI